MIHNLCTNRWYKEDKNCLPPSCLLQPISTHLPDFLNNQNKDKCTNAKNSWWCEHEKMQKILEDAACKVLKDPERYYIAGKYIAVPINKIILSVIVTFCHRFKY